MDFHTETNPGGSRETRGESPRSTEFTLSDPVDSFVSAARNLFLNPRGFFRSIARQGDFIGPLIFALICSVISGMLSGIVGAFAALGERGVGGIFLGLAGNILLTPVIAVVGIFVTAGIWHALVLLLVGPNNAGFEATFRVAAYLMVIQLIVWVAAIPILGIFIASLVGIYGLYLAYLGIQEVHSATRQRAAAVVAIPALIAIVLTFVLGILFAAAFS